MSNAVCVTTVVLTSVAAVAIVIWLLCGFAGGQLQKGEMVARLPPRLQDRETSRARTYTSAVAFAPLLPSHARRTPALHDTLGSRRACKQTSHVERTQAKVSRTTSCYSSDHSQLPAAARKSRCTTEWHNWQALKYQTLFKDLGSTTLGEVRMRAHVILDPW